MTEQIEDAIEIMADVEHERWCGWYIYQRDHSINPDNVIRWNRLSSTPYSALDGPTKEWDRVEVRKTIAALEAAGFEIHIPTITDEDVKRAPVQGYSAGIPWSMHLRAYDAYCAKWSPQEALIDLEGRNCRGGFGVEELDEFIPGWRDELSTIAKLQAEIDSLRDPTITDEDVERAWIVWNEADYKLGKNGWMRAALTAFVKGLGT